MHIETNKNKMTVQAMLNQQVQTCLIHFDLT